MTKVPPEVFQKTKATTEFLGVAALLAMLAWFCDEMLFLSQIPFFRDLVTYFYPIEHSVAQAFQAGSLPLWDRHMATGFPVMAGFQSAVMYPPTAAFYLLPFSAAIRFIFVFHFAVAATGSYLLFRAWKSPLYMSLLGALLFAFGGTMVSLTNLLNHFQSAVWLPWVVLCWERAIKTASWKNLLILSIALLFQLLAGSPEIFLLSLGLLLLDAFRLYSEGEIRSPLHSVLLVLGCGIVLVGLGMVQFLPTAELVFQSRRDQPIPAVEALAWSLQPSSLLGVFLPTLEADASLTVGIRLLLTDGVPFFLSHYIGLIGLVGLCCWFKSARVKERLILLGLIAISLLLAFGKNTPVYPFLYEWLPFLRIMRFPEKYFYVTFALLIFAIVRGMTRVSLKGEFRTCSVIAASAFVLWLVVYGLFRLRLQILEHVLYFVRGGPIADVFNPVTIASILVVLEKQVAVSLVLTLLFYLNWRGVLRKSLFQALIVLTVFLDLSSANKPLLFVRDEKLIQSVPRILEEPPGEPSRVFYYPPGRNLHPSFMRVAGNPTYEKATEIALNNLLPNAGLLYGFDYFQDIDALGRRSYTDFLNFINDLPVEQRGKLLRAINVKYVVAFHPLDVKGLKLVREFPQHYSRLYEVINPVPRAYLVGRATYQQDPLRTLRLLSSASFDPSQEVIIDARTHLPAAGRFQGEATITDYQNNEVQIHARLDKPGVLVLTDAYYPGWKVFVDNRPQIILRANYLFRGVELPAGNHTVQFVYDPISFKIGLFVSILTAALLVLIPLASCIWRRIFVSQIQPESAQIPATTIADRSAM